jgi:hypothetical protein
MKKHILMLCTGFLLAGMLAANPIMIESLIRQIIFDEEDNWSIVIENMMINAIDPQDFDEVVHISCNAGPLVFKEDFLPELTQETTVITKEDLLYPLNIPRAGDSVLSSMDDGWFSFDFMPMVWNDTLPSPVFGPLAGQALSLTYFNKTMEDTEWWIVKDGSPTTNYGLGNCDCYGTFSGYVYDLAGNPVPGTTIHYIDESYVEFPFNPFDELNTDNEGFFSIDELPARNYFILRITKPGNSFFIEEYIAIEPGANTYDFTIDYLVGEPEKEAGNGISVSNFPNPFDYHTVFEIQRGHRKSLKGAVLQITDIVGRTMAVIPLGNAGNGDGTDRIWWNRPDGLAPGNYMYILILDNHPEARGKMTIR